MARDDGPEDDRPEDEGPETETPDVLNLDQDSAVAASGDEHRPSRPLTPISDTNGDVKRLLAETDARFERLVEGLSASSLGERLGAVNRFFDNFGPVELATLELPSHLGQLRAIYLGSR